MTAQTEPTMRLRTELWHEGDVAATPPHPNGWAQHALMTRGNALVLVPLADRTAAASSLLRWTDAETLTTSATRMAAWAGMRTGLAQPLMRHRTWIRTAGPASLHDHIGQALDVAEVHIAGNFGPPRPNQKPVLRIFDQDGATAAFGKVGWNQLTSGLVDHEADFLARAPRLRDANVSFPRLLDLGRWTDRTVALVSVVVGGFHWRRMPAPGVDVLKEVAAMADTYSVTLASSAYRTRLDVSQETAAVSIRPALAAIDERAAGIALPFGRWHGDWTPWNMRTTGSRLIVWDWERTAPDTPVGFDALHYEVQSRIAQSDTAPLSTFIDAVAAATPIFRALDVPLLGIPVVACLYLAELVVRFGTATQQPKSRVGWLDGLLDDAIRHFSAN